MTRICCVRFGAYMMVDVFVTLGIVIPMLLSSVCFGERITPRCIIGSAAAFAAMLYINLF